MIKPTKDRLLLLPLTPEKMVGLLHIPENKSTRNKTFYQALVLAVGPASSKSVEYERIAKVGDVVLLDEYGGDKVEGELHDAKYEGKKLLLIRERDITGVLDGKVARVTGGEEETYPELDGLPTPA